MKMPSGMGKLGKLPKPIKAETFGKAFTVKAPKAAKFPKMAKMAKMPTLFRGSPHPGTEPLPMMHTSKDH